MIGWRDALARTRRAMAEGLRSLFRPGRPDERTLEMLEETLIRADVPSRVAAALLEEARTQTGGETFSDRLAAVMTRMLGSPPADVLADPGEGVRVILLAGVNGAGKTTTAAKLARRLLKAGGRPLLAAADTFRAAGSQQLQLWAERVPCECVAGRMGADPAAVAFDAVQAARARGAHAVIVDTAGRMHTREALMAELQKVGRSVGKAHPGAPHDVWLVLDATTGSNALSQARHFHETLPLTGLIVAKLDGSAKAGFVFGIRRELAVPLRYAGLGEGMDDLVPFDPAAFVQAILARPEETT